MNSLSDHFICIPSGKIAAVEKKATADAILLTVSIVWLLALTGVIFRLPWLISVIYALAQFVALVLRLRW